MAVKVEELRIGNLVAYHGETVEVKGLPELGLVYFDSSLLPCPHLTTGEEVSPIPISEEWLLKFGLEKEGNNLFTSNKQVKEISNKDIGVTAPSFFFNSRLNRWMDSQTRVCIDYVHQLQNLTYALTGQELTPKTVSL